MEKTLKQRPSKCLRIVLFGPESTGKTTLARQLATHYHTLWVPEFMREYLEKKWNDKKELIAREDLLPIAYGQLISENKKIGQAANLLFCDTNLRELKVYAKYYYEGYCPPQIVAASQEHSYDLYLLTYIDTPWEEDNLRDRPNDRQNMFCIFEDELKKNKLPYLLIKGDEKERLTMAINAISKLQTS